MYHVFRAMPKISRQLYLSFGQSLFEVIISVGVAALIVTALVSLASNSIRNATFSRNNTLASKHAQEATEWLRGERDNDISTFMTNVQIPTWCLDLLDWSQASECGASDFITGTPFLREVAFAITPLSGKNLITATITVSWNDAQGYHEVVSVTQFTDWRQR